MIQRVNDSPDLIRQMSNQSTILTPAAISLDHSSEVPLHRQLYDIIRSAILEGKLRAGAQLPSTRALAAMLEVSRTTVIGAFDQLRAEGYLDGKKGSGTFVAASLPDDLLRVRSKGKSEMPRSVQTGPISKRGTLWASTAASFCEDSDTARAFQPGLPAIDDFPFDVWSRMLAKRWRHASNDIACYGDAAGYRPLRDAIASYVQLARGVHCEPEQVIIVAGSQQGLDMVARILLDPGDPAWVEDPGYRGACGALLG